MKRRKRGRVKRRGLVRQGQPGRVKRREGGRRRTGPRGLETLRAELEQRVARETSRWKVARETSRWNAHPEDVQRSVARLVLTLVEFLRRLFERQALRRMEARTLTAAETEALGLALMRLEDTIRDLARRFDLALEDLNLDLGPLGRLR